MQPSHKMTRDSDRERALLIEGSALALRANGFDYDEIAKRLGIRRDMASKAVKRGMKRYKQECLESVKQIADLENYRLDQLFFAAYAHIQRGDPKAIEIALKVMDRRAKLLGLDAPAKVVSTGATAQVNVTQEVTLEDLKSIEAKLAAMENVNPAAEEDSVDLGFDGYDGAEPIPTEEERRRRFLDD